MSEFQYCAPLPLIALAMSGGAMKFRKTWALVTNGTRALILCDLDDGDSGTPMEIISKSSFSHLRDYLSDREGRSFSSGSAGRRSAMEPGSDPVLHDMQDFVQEILEQLESHLRTKDFERLAIFAAPKVLGLLRQRMSTALRGHVVLERSTNLIGIPTAEMREIVRRVLMGEAA